MQCYDTHQGMTRYMYSAMPQNSFMTAYDQYMYPQNFPMALQVIKKTIDDEREKAQFYDYLICSAPSEEDKKLIGRIRDTESNHIKLLKQLYCELTGQVLPPPCETSFTKPSSYCEGIKRAIFEEAQAIEQHKKIFFALVNRRHINMITDIITDEIRHADLFNLLYSKNACYKEEKICN